jgi:hypothetical protein
MNTPHNRAGATPAPAGPGALAGRIPGRVLQTARSNPLLAIRLLHPRTVADPVLLAILRAEVHLRLTQRTQATSEALRAATLAAHETPVTAERMLTAATVLADLCCTTDDPDAAAVCTDLRELADRFSDTPRAQLADILHAVAVYQRVDCRRGRTLLAHLHEQAEQAGHHPFAATLAAGLPTMDAWCTPPLCGPFLLTRPLTPVPGGLLHPDPAAVSPTWIAERIRAHGCAGTHRPRGPDDR